MEKKNTYKVINKRTKNYGFALIGLSSAFGSSLGTAIVISHGEPGVFIPSMVLAAGLLFCTGKVETNYNSLKYCDEFMKLKESYNSIIKQILESIDNLKLTDIIEIFAYVSYLLNNGYLAYDKSKQSTIYDPGFSQLNEILRELSLNNHGNAKSKALFLADILNTSSIVAPATILTGNLIDEKKFAISVNQEDVKEYFGQLIGRRNIYGKKNITYTNQELVEYLISTGKISFITNPRGKDINHAITVAVQDMSCYYFDVVNEKFLYKLNGFENVLVGDNIAFSIAGENQKRKNWYYEINPAALEEHKQESKDIVEKKYNDAKELIISNSREVGRLYDSIHPELEKAEHTYQKILKSC